MPGNDLVEKRKNFAKWAQKKYLEYRDAEQAAGHGIKSIVSYARVLGVSASDLTGWMNGERGLPNVPNLMQLSHTFGAEVFVALGYTMPSTGDEDLDAINRTWFKAPEKARARFVKSLLQSTQQDDIDAQTETSPNPA
jgi:transcriptional regulator with XRE-family HTH domain